MSIEARMSRWAERLGEVFDWSVETVRDTLPMPLRTFGFRDEARIAGLGPDGRLQVRAIRQKSLLGATRLVAPEAGRLPARLVVELAPDQQYRKRIALSAAALRRGDAALALRRDDFIPIPPETARYAAALVESRDRGGAEVELAVVRAETRDVARQAAAQAAPDWEVVGGVAPDGRPRHRFAAARPAGRSPALQVGALLLVLAIVLVAWTARADRDARDLEDRRARLIEMARDQRDYASDLARFDALQASAAADPQLGAVLDALSGLTDRLDPAWSVERIRLDRSGVLQVQTGQPTTNGVETVMLAHPVEAAP